VVAATICRTAIAVLLFTGIADAANAQSLQHYSEGSEAVRRGERVFREACRTCHSATGTGSPQALVGFDIPLPDFTDCNFATREAHGDWVAVVHQGGPARGFSRLMPAFGVALTDEEIDQVLAYIRTFCPDPNWPRGELNLPRALFTEKAYPEDELVATTGFSLERPAAVALEIVYERRFGARNQFELSVPLEARHRQDDRWTGGFGDIALGLKRDLYHSNTKGTIFSGAVELILPTGDEDDAVGSGTTIFEPFVSFGQILPADGFVQLQAGAGFPFNTDRANEEGFWRGVLGKTFSQHRFGRSWTPMVEVLGSREFASGQKTLWDVVPQMQVSLSTRQHVLGNVGFRIPINETGARQTQLLFYILWDYFDGPFLAGW